MTENFVATDFLSRDNTTILYKHVTMANNMTNLNKQQKDQIIGIIIDTMKKTYKTLDLSQINKSNMMGVKKQFNDIIIKQACESVKKTSFNKPNTSMHDRMIQREFHSIVKPVPQPNDRPSATSFGGNTHGSAPSHANVDFTRRITTDVGISMKELEDARRGENVVKPPSDMPDWLKPIRVGKANDMNHMNPVNPVNNSCSFIGFSNDPDSNFSSNVPRTDPAKYNENQSVTDRLKQMEAERGMAIQIAPSPSGNTPNPTMYEPQPQPQPDQQQINELQTIIMNLKNENEHIKSQLHLQNQKNPLTKKLQLEVIKTESSYNFKFNPINNVIGLKLVQYNLPPPIYNIVDDMIIKYETNNEKHIMLSKGHYTITTMIEQLNNNKDLVFTVNVNQKLTVKCECEFKIIPTLLWQKLGFINNTYEPVTQITAERIYDIRPPHKLLLLIKNINPKQPVCGLNFNGSSICDIPFTQPIVMTNLDFEFYTEDGILYCFNDIAYSLCFIIEVIDS